MAANENTKFQINYKLSDGTLINLYAQDVKDLETGLNDLGMVAALIKATATDLGGGATAAAVQNIQAQFNATPVAVTSTGGAYTCKHGGMTFRQSKPGAPKEWKGYFCPTPQGTADQCEPKFLRG